MASKHVTQKCEVKTNLSGIDPCQYKKIFVSPKCTWSLNRQQKRLVRHKLISKSCLIRVKNHSVTFRECLPWLGIFAGREQMFPHQPQIWTTAAAIERLYVSVIYSHQIAFCALLAPISIRIEIDCIWMISKFHLILKKVHQSNWLS